jgi:hypothetical protein
MPSPSTHTHAHTHTSYVPNLGHIAGLGDTTVGRLLELASGGAWDLVWAQQYWTMTDQLRMGVRQLMIDPVWFADEMRMCHCGTSFPWFDKVLAYLEKVR